jgi:hypothetical protein
MPHRLRRFSTAFDYLSFRSRAIFQMRKKATRVMIAASVG